MMHLYMHAALRTTDLESRQYLLSSFGFQKAVCTCTMGVAFVNNAMKPHLNLTLSVTSGEFWKS